MPARDMYQTIDRSHIDLTSARSMSNQRSERHHSPSLSPFLAPQTIRVRMMVGAEAKGPVVTAQQIFRDGGLGGFFRCVLLLLQVSVWQGTQHFRGRARGDGDGDVEGADVPLKSCTLRCTAGATWWDLCQPCLPRASASCRSR